ncbi:Hypothetical predicted protein, partial [Mytilus galloprovincialis]
MEDRNKVKRCSSQSAKNKMIVDILMNRPSDIRDTLLEALSNSDHDYSELIDRIRKSTADNSLKMKTSEIHECTIRLQKNYHMIVQQMSSLESVIDELISEDVLSLDDTSEIMSKTSRSEQVRELIGKIRHTSTYEKFLLALRQDSVNAQLAEALDRTEVSEMEKLSHTA